MRIWGMIAFALFLALVPGSRAHAAPSLVVLEDNGSENAVYRDVMESLAALIVSNNLGKHYSHIDLLTGKEATREQLFGKIRERGRRGSVDVMVLTHGQDKALSLEAGDLTESDIRAAGPLPRLRLVYMMACWSSSLVEAWKAAGAQVAIGHQEVNSLPGFFFPRFVRRWGEGATARDAALDAHRFAEGTARMLSGYIHETELLDSSGVARSEPRIAGVDVDLSGRIYPEHDLLIAPMPPSRPLRSVRPTRPHVAVAELLGDGGFAAFADGEPRQAMSLLDASADRSSAYPHTAFESLGIQLLGTLIPQATLDPAAIPSAQALLDQVDDAAWAQLKDSFPASIDGLPGMGLEAPMGDDIWVDGEALRYLLASLREFAGGKLSSALDRVQGLRLARSKGALEVVLYFDRGFTLSLMDEEEAPNWRPYGVRLPAALRLRIQMRDGELSLEGLDRGPEALTLLIKMPWLPDEAWLRRVTLNLVTGKFSVDAGVVLNQVAVVAGGELSSLPSAGIDLWGTLARNAAMMVFPALDFRIVRF